MIATLATAPAALHDQQPTRGGHELALPDGVINMSHDNAVGWHDRATENGDAEVEYPTGCLLRYERHDNKQGRGGSERCPMMARRRSSRSESQPRGQVNRNPPRVPHAMYTATKPVSSPRRRRNLANPAGQQQRLVSAQRAFLVFFNKNINTRS
jgi:hypothetical protein